MKPNVTDKDYDKKMKAIEALYNVIDPELFVNVIDLGLIYEIDFRDDEIDITMTLSTPHCPMGEAITNGVSNALDSVFPGKKVNIDLTFDPPWNFEMLTSEGRVQLGM
jgi:metal-sulfur cluster biosynthetic enzyme